jgi:hypothetical protein
VSRQDSAAAWLDYLPPAEEPEPLPGPLTLTQRNQRLPAAIREADRNPYSPEAAAVALDAIARGLRLDTVPGLPSSFALARWRAQVPGVEDAYRLAIELRADALLDRAESHALDPDMPAQEAKLRADVLLKAAGLRSKRYAPRRGEDDMTAPRRELATLSDGELAALVAEARALPPGEPAMPAASQREGTRAHDAPRLPDAAHGPRLTRSPDATAARAGREPEGGGGPACSAPGAGPSLHDPLQISASPKTSFRDTP